MTSPYNNPKLDKLLNQPLNSPLLSYCDDENDHFDSYVVLFSFDRSTFFCSSRPHSGLFFFRFVFLRNKLGDISYWEELILFYLRRLFLTYSK